MSSPYLGRGGSSGGSGTGSVYTQRGSAPSSGGSKSAKKKGHHGPLGFVQNLGEDIASTAQAFGPGLIHTGAAVVRDVKDDPWLAYAPFVAPLAAKHFMSKDSEIGQEVIRPTLTSYKNTYNRDFLHNFYGHPLGPLLDAATLVSLGTTGAVRAGLIPATRTLDLTVGAKTFTRSVSHKGAAMNKLAKLIDLTADRWPDVPKIEVHRFASELRRLPRKDAARLQLQVRDYNQAVKNFSGREFTAAHLIGKGLSPADYRAFLEGRVAEGKFVEPAMLKLLADPKLDALYEAPSAKLLKGAEEARKLSGLGEDLYRRLGVVSEESVTDRPYLSARIASGAEFTDEGLVGGKSIDAIKADLADTGRSEPFYVPDSAIKKRAINQGLNRQGGGVANPKKLGSMKQNQGTLLEMGMLALNSDLLGPEFLNRVKFAYHQDLHNQLEATATKVAKGYKLQPGERYLLRRNERIPHTEKVAGDTQENLLRDVPRGEKGEVFSTESEELAATDAKGNRLVIPEQLARSVGGEFTRASKGVRWFVENPTKVWRHMVLGLRVGFLVNNLVGNHLLYAIKFGGHGALRAYLNMVRESHGAAYVRRMLHTTSKERGGGISRQFMDEMFSEQVTGTFGGTQAPFANSRATLGINNPLLRRGAKVARGNLLPATQALAETGLRRAATEVSLRSAPEVKRILRELPGRERSLVARMPAQAKRFVPRMIREVYDFEAAAKQALELTPGLERKISTRVNDSLGDYLGMSAFERNSLRAIFPFYAWYKAIFRITGKLVVDNPLRANILQQFAQVDKEFQDSLPVYLRGVARAQALDGLLGGTPAPGTSTVISTAGFNPFGTITQVGTAAGGILGLSATPPGQSIGGNFNPFVAALVEWLSGRDMYTGQDVSRRPGGVFGNVYGNVLAEIPFAKLAKPREPSSVYPQRDRRSELLSFLGVPVKRPNLDRARELENR